jgi:hypothetical protein
MKIYLLSIDRSLLRRRPIDPLVGWAEQGIEVAIDP